MSQLLNDFLNGQPHPDAPPVVARTIMRIVRLLRWYFGYSPIVDPPGESGQPPDAGKPSPLAPSPSHHLIAAKSLPPGEATYTLATD